MNSLTEQIAKQIRYVASLPQELKNALLEYQGDSFVNRNLRMKLDYGEWEEFDLRTLRNLERIFAEIPPLEQALTVYRGIVIYSEEKLDTYDGAFISTTLDKGMAEQFIEGISDCCILQITVSPGSKVLPLVDPSLVFEEDEVILYRKGELLITGREGNTIFVTYLPKDSIKVVSDRAIIRYAHERETEGSEACVVS